MYFFESILAFSDSDKVEILSEMAVDEIIMDGWKSMHVKYLQINASVTPSCLGKLSDIC